MDKDMQSDKETQFQRHLTGEEVFFIANGLEDNPLLKTHLNNCPDCQLSVEKEQAFSSGMTQRMKVVQKVDLSEAVRNQLTTKEKWVISTDATYFAYFILVLSAYIVGSTLNLNLIPENTLTSFPKIPYFSSIFAAVALLTGFMAYLNFRTKRKVVE